jgi:hypothetical protein
MLPVRDYGGRIRSRPVPAVRRNECRRVRVELWGFGRGNVLGLGAGNGNVGYGQKYVDQSLPAVLAWGRRRDGRYGDTRWSISGFVVSSVLEKLVDRGQIDFGFHEDQLALRTWLGGCVEGIVSVDSRSIGAQDIGRAIGLNTLSDNTTSRRRCLEALDSSPPSA